MDLERAAEAIESTRVLARLDPARSALLLIHWQVDIVTESGAMGPHFAAMVRKSGAIERTMRVVAQARVADLKLVYVNVAYDHDGSDITVNGPLWAHVKQVGGCRRGSRGAEVVSELTPLPGDQVVEHGRVSAFSDSGLGAWLRGRELHTLLLCGVATNIAVEGTARSAADDGFATVLIEDCCVAATYENHESSVRSQRAFLSEVVRSEDVITALC